ncbi:uncharacterized protein LOC103724030 [Phoenix dactylifera]|uniref:Uncharacterized protein LOC103724030 n=1 Tax=Phoenix dactylifera TaxID=42345 RepID=A0A8B7D525_PHODC|nr:uncharacterized protein LOC103724030 [Phoenix dactylifera]
MANPGRCRRCCRFAVCSPTAAILLILISAVPLALIASLERSPSIRYHSRGWLRECAKWDALGRRFLVSTLFDGVVAEIPVPEAAEAGPLEERTVVADGDVAGNASLGIAVDRARRRLLVVYADARRFRFSAVAAYDLDSWDRLFLARLSGPGDEDSFADDVAVDEEGNAYVTDAKANKIWKVGLNGELLSVIRSEVFIQRKEWYYNFVGLNGIVYHPNGYLLVIHTASGYLFKMDPVKEEVSVVKVAGSLLMGDGMDFLSPTKLVIAGSLSTKLVESSDDWKTAKVIEKYVGPLHRIASSATVKDGKVYLNHLLGGGLAKTTHVIAEAVFTSTK